MRKTKTSIAILASAALVSAALVGCGSSSKPANNSNSNTQSNTAQTSNSTASNMGEQTGSLIEENGAAVEKIAFVMVGDTPNFQVTFANNTANDVDFDMSKFEIAKEDGTPVDFHLTTKKIEAGRPYAQNTFTTSAGTLKVGDKVNVKYNGKDLGSFEVGEF